jgi:hypothetical protein
MGQNARPPIWRAGRFRLPDSPDIHPDNTGQTRTNTLSDRSSDIVVDPDNLRVYVPWT